jgi:hypothetical protein
LIYWPIWRARTSPPGSPKAAFPALFRNNS